MKYNNFVFNLVTSTLTLNTIFDCLIFVRIQFGGFRENWHFLRNIIYADYPQNFPLTTYSLRKISL